MAKIVEIVNELPDLLSTGEADKLEIESAEKSLGLKFSAEYSEYLAAFGSILADDIEITGITKSQNRNVVTMTEREWKLNPKVPHNLYVIENLAIDGIIIWQDETGRIFQSIPNEEISFVANNLAEYIENKQYITR